MFEEVHGLTLFGKVKTVLTRPKEFFELVKAEEKLSSALKYIIVMQLIFLPLASVILFINIEPKSSFSITSNLITIAAKLGAVLLLALLSHIIVPVLHGKGSVKRTIQAFMYGYTPMVVIGWFPVLDWIAMLYSAYIIVVGLKTVHEMSFRKAIFAFIFPFLIIVTINFVGISSLLRFR